MFPYRLVCAAFLLSAFLPIHAESAGTAVVDGVVITASNEPATAEIALYRLTSVDGAIVPSGACFTRVGVQRYFRCEHLPEGTYVLVVTPHRPRSVSASITPNPRKIGKEESAGLPEQTTPLFAVFPSLNSGLQNLIHLHDGQSETVTVSLEADTISLLKVSPALGIATGQVQIFAQGEGFSLPLNIRAGTDPVDGNYIWDGVPPGAYRVIEDWSEDQDPVRHYAIQAVLVAPFSSQQVSLANARTYRVIGRVESLGQPLLPGLGLVLMATSGDDKKTYSAVAQKNGSFALNDISEGLYHVSMSANSAANIEQVSLSGRTLLDQMIFVSEATASQSLIITVVPAKGAVAGTVQLDGSEVKPAVVIRSLDSQTAIVLPVTTGGSFQATHLTSGRYRIYGWADISRVPYNTPSFLASYKDQSVEVEITDNSPVMGLDLRCIHAAL